MVKYKLGSSMSNQRRSSAILEEEERSSPLTVNKGFAPSFYRIIMPSVLGQHTPVLPKNFVEEHGDELSSSIQLHLPVDSDKLYNIRLNKSGDLVFLHDGWEKFMNHYSICFGWFLLFKYRGNSVFHVHIFDRKATEIQYLSPASSPNFGKSSYTKGDVVCKEEFDDDDAEIREKQRVFEDAAWKMFNTVNPSFNVTMRDHNVRRRYVVNLPAEFTRKHMNGCPESIRIVDSDKKMWGIRCANYGGQRRLCKGWAYFVREKGLQIGDVCVFQVVKKNAILKVDIFYAKKGINK